MTEAPIRKTGSKIVLDIGSILPPTTRIQAIGQMSGRPSKAPSCTAHGLIEVLRVRWLEAACHTFRRLAYRTTIDTCRSNGRAKPPAEGWYGDCPNAPRLRGHERFKIALIPAGRLERDVSRRGGVRRHGPPTNDGWHDRQTTRPRHPPRANLLRAARIGWHVPPRPIDAEQLAQSYQPWHPPRCRLAQHPAR